MMLRFLLPVLCLLILPAITFANGCGGPKNACALNDRSYHLKLPDEWDGITPLPVMLHFHGWARQGGLIVQHQRISGHTRRRGVLLVAPNGNNRTWDFWDEDSADVPFAAAVLEDVAKRFPIDRSRIYVSGYSYGAAMAWRYVCENGNDVAALIAVSGTLRQPEDCAQGPREVRQVYGFNDNVMPLNFGPGHNETLPVDMWVSQYECGASDHTGPWKAVDWLSFDRRIWRDCAGGQKVTLDLHKGGHFIPHGWIGWQLDQLMGRTPRYP